MNTPTQNIDALTGTFAKEMFETDFQSAIELAESKDQQLSLVCLDCDRFLDLNQNHGRDVGDQVLRMIGELLLTRTSESVSVYRYGGDEFYLIFPDTLREEALLTMEKIRMEIAQPRRFDGAELEVQISIGISSYPIDGSESGELQRKADQALYRAKKDGRGRVLLAYDEKMVPKTVHFTETQLERLSALAEERSLTEARLLREALDDLILKYTVNKIEE